MRIGNVRKPNATTARLIAAARAFHSDEGPVHHGMVSSDTFVRAYIDWINAHNAIPGQPAERMDRVRLMMLAMLAAADLEQALAILVRYSGLALGGENPVRTLSGRNAIILHIERDFQPGVEGYIRELWPLSLHLSLLECLIGGALTGVYGVIRHPSPLLPPDMTGLLFDRPLDHGGDTLQLSIPMVHLRRGIIATPEQVSTFLPRLLPSSYEKATGKAQFAVLVTAMLRTDKLRNVARPSTLQNVAERLGCSPATLRRHLTAEGSSFRDIRSSVHDELAKHWLTDRKTTCTVIAERLGYADVFSFGRSFSRLNGCSPSLYRQQRLETMA